GMLQAPAADTLASPRIPQAEGATTAVGPDLHAPDTGWRRGAVPRRRLVRRLIASRDVRVVLLAAPGGYGKSVLLYEWASVDERPFAWLTLEPHHNDAARLIAGISDALETTSGLRASGPWLAGLVCDLGRQPHPVVLVLDAAELLESRSALDVVE